MRTSWTGGQNRQGPTTSSNKPSGRSSKILYYPSNKLLIKQSLLTFLKIKN
ncbi:hypothetical protein DDB_G0280389 [Dictyostelium discoideum AX4]|uniref:Uncharacterized protein n=1 Tax=Dictyostelium discoideum TaxID=44689 RepID=Q54VK8_DICDI|nr:hypothetical protein DDB_G0280389 [Dictyostelium discoideum AX4]EAL67421.1 hypothetical protein DDB_G0280389 [Dictyostelium discoideum AX4]|eukprot:XP_641347.1 hypothetical protein DDB_G0280389 [Dictyostelium discoideum AX4]